MLLFHPEQKIGPALFFFVKGQFLIHSCSIEEGDQNSDFVNFPLSHMDVWNKFYARKYHVDFDYYPRGRIVYRRADDTYLLYYDKCIATDITELIDVFPDRKIIADLDEHYQCHHCNEFYVI